MKVLAHYRSNTQQRGGVLVMFVLLVFGLMAVAALVIDIGMASATQGQMQSAVDSAALEGLRLRNTELVVDMTDGSISFLADHIDPNPEPLEIGRRNAAVDIIRWSFDDDLDVAGGSSGYTVGPDLELTGGVGAADAFALIEFGDNQAIQNPTPRVNLDSVGGFNVVAGDMVSGEFDPYMSHSEAADYSRLDFTPAQSWPASRDSGAFLVRMRRTGETSVDDSSQIGPTIPYLFGRGSLIRGDGLSNPRRDGIAVRATAIAAAQPALQVGRVVLDPSRNRRGVARYALKWSAWRDIEVTLNDPVCVKIEGGRLFLIPTAGEPGEETFLGVLLDLGDQATAVGQRIELPLVPAVDPPFSELEVWVPLYADVLGTDRVIGFAYAELGDPEPIDCFVSGSPLTSTFSFAKRASDVASENASATFPSSTDDLGKLEWDELFRLRREMLADARGEPLLAPALSR